MTIDYILALTAATIDLLGSLHYIREVVGKRTRPHIFSWLVWFLLMSIGAAISVSEGACAAAISLGLGGLCSLAVCLLGLRLGGQRYIRPTDWAALIASLLAIPLWFVTKDAFWAALMITGINLSGCYPSLRKAWVLPAEENLRSFLMYTVSGSLRLAAVSPFTVTTALYPATIVVMDLALVGVIVFRRSLMKKGEKHGL